MSICKHYVIAEWIIEPIKCQHRRIMLVMPCGSVVIFNTITIGRKKSVPRVFEQVTKIKTQQKKCKDNSKKRTPLVPEYFRQPLLVEKPFNLHSNKGKE